MKTSISIKLFSGFLIVIALNVFYIVIVSKLYSLNKTVTILKKQNDVKNQLLQMANLHSERKRSRAVYQEIRKPESAENFIAASSRMAQVIDSVRLQLESIDRIDSALETGSSVPSQNRRQVQRLIAIVGSDIFPADSGYRAVFNKLKNLVVFANPISELDFVVNMSAGDEQNARFVQALQRADVEIDRLTGNRIADIEQSINNVKQLTVVFMVGLPFFTLVFGIIFSRAITNSMRRLKVAASSIGTGDFNFNRTGYPADEIGDLANAFFEMANNLKTTQEELVKSKRLAAIGEIIASVNHEINNPLMIISGNAQFLEMMMKDSPPEMKERVQTILEETDRISKVTRKLREIRNPVVEDYTSSGEQMINLEKSAQ